MPVHYLNQCWNIVNWSLGKKLRWNFYQNTKLFIHENTFENIVCEMAAILFRRRWVNKQARNITLKVNIFRIQFLCLHIMVRWLLYWIHAWKRVDDSNISHVWQLLFWESLYPHKLWLLPTWYPICHHLPPGLLSTVQNHHQQSYFSFLMISKQPVSDNCCK